MWRLKSWRTFESFSSSSSSSEGVRGRGRGGARGRMTTEPRFPLTLTLSPGERGQGWTRLPGSNGTRTTPAADFFREAARVSLAPRGKSYFNPSSRPEPLTWMFHKQIDAAAQDSSSAGFQTCCVADFQIGNLSVRPKRSRVWKPAIRQTGKSAPRFECEKSGLSRSRRREEAERLLNPSRPPRFLGGYEAPVRGEHLDGGETIRKTI